MIIRKLFIILLPAVIFGCSEQAQKSTKNLSNLTTFEVMVGTELNTEIDESFRGAQNAGVNKIGEITVDATGNVYFVDEFDQKIQAVDATGKPIGTMGRAGGRPGEFRKLSTIQVRNGKLYGYDDDRKAMNVYDTQTFDFEYSTVFSASKLLVDSLKTANANSAMVLPDGNYLVGFQMVKSPTDRQLFFYKVDKDGDVISDEILSFPSKPLFVEKGPDGMIIMMMPYERETLLSSDAAGSLYTIFTEDFVIQKHDSAGNYEQAWQYSSPKRKLNRTDAIDMFEEVDIRRAIRGAKLPGSWPAVSKVLIDEENQFWVATITQDLSVFRWYKIDASGKMAGMFDLPRSMDVKVAQHGYLYARKYNPSTYREEVLRIAVQ